MIVIMSKIEIKSIATLQTLLGFDIGQIRDENQNTIDKIEKWMMEIISKPKNKSMQEKKNRCEICNSREEPYNLEQHHISGVKHSHHTIIIDRHCHQQLSQQQKIWDNRWMKKNQPENVRLGFLLLGIHDVLMLKGKKTGISAYEELAKKLCQRIYQTLSAEGDYV